MTKPELFLPSRLVAAGVPIPDGWVLDPVRDGMIPPPAGRPRSDAAVSTEQAAVQDTYS